MRYLLLFLLFTGAALAEKKQSRPALPELIASLRIEVAQQSCSPRKTCGQIRSCDEAIWYLYNCSWGGRLDGDSDSDGAPCENLCGSNK